MPTYHARGVSVRMGASPLADTITPDLVLKKGEIAKNQCEAAEQKLLGSELLHEKRVGFLEQDDGFELNWLGGAPFMQVKTGASLFGEDSDEDQQHPVTTVNPAGLQRRSAINNTYVSKFRGCSDPLALSLHVQLSDTTFISGLNPNNRVHLKIDVLFNGKLSSCLFVPLHDIRSGAKTMHQLFSGYRTDYLAERPWVILPPHRTANGSIRKPGSVLPTEKRWEEICKALEQEGAVRGQDKHGNIPPSAELLKALAAMKMPSEVATLQRSGNKSFGTIDVIITAGDGRKVTNGTSYLTAPQRLVDENYPIRPVPDVATITGSIVGLDDADTQNASNVSDPVEEVTDADAEGESDSDYKPRPKRRAMAPRVLSMQPISKIASASRPKIRRSETLRAQLPDAVSVTPSHPTMSTASIHSSGRFPSSQMHPDGALSSPERGRSHQQEQSQAVGPYTFGSTPREAFQSFSPFPSSSAGLASTPRMLPSRYSLQCSDLLLGQDSPSSLMGLSSHGNIGYLSSPMQQVPQNMITPTPSLFPRQAVYVSEGSQETRGLPLATAGAVSSQCSRRGSASSIRPPQWGTFATRPPTLDHYVQDSMSVGSRDHAPDMLGVSTPLVTFSGRARDGVPFSPPLHRPFPMSLPPTGMFSVTTKPRSSRSPSKKSQTSYQNKDQHNLRVSRLVILGKDGVALLDHEWSTAQHIPVKAAPLDGERSSGDSSSPESLTNSLRPTAQSTTDEWRSQQPVSDAHVSSVLLQSSEPGPLSSFPDKKHCLESDAQKVEDVAELPSCLPPALPIATEASGREDKAEKSDLNAPSQHSKSIRYTVATSTVPQRRVSSSTNILGKQGPKANPFWFEDPEEIMREAARLRRSRSPIKRVKKPIANVNATLPAQLASGNDITGTVSSSPLSSAISSPELPEGLTLISTSTVLAKPWVSNEDRAIVQVDGSPERRIVNSLPRKIKTPSPTKKLASTTTPRLPPNARSTPMSSLSSNTKKRKMAGRSMLRAPRSPDRLKTVSNPPLNRDCVIAFAESEDTESTQGILRQVKGERQGIFAEEYVVLATRFFIAGT